MKTGYVIAFNAFVRAVEEEYDPDKDSEVIMMWDHGVMLSKKRAKEVLRVIRTRARDYELDPSNYQIEEVHIHK